MLGYLKQSFRNFVIFTGRATRREFWLFAALFAIATVGGYLLDGRSGTTEAVVADMGIAQLVAFLALLLPFVAVSVRRLHDAGRSGFWLLFLYLPYLVFQVAGPREAAQQAAAGAFLIGALVVFIQWVLPGEKGDNRFGPNPLRAATT